MLCVIFNSKFLSVSCTLLSDALALPKPVRGDEDGGNCTLVGLELREAYPRPFEPVNTLFTDSWFHVEPVVTDVLFQERPLVHTVANTTPMMETKLFVRRI